MLLTLRTVYHRQTIEVDDSDSIEALRAKIAERTNVPIDQQRLLLNGSLLPTRSTSQSTSTQSLKQLGLADQATIVVMRERQYGPRPPIDRRMPTREAVQAATASLTPEYPPIDDAELSELTNEQVERRLETLLRAILGIPIDDAEYASLTESQERAQQQQQQQQPVSPTVAATAVVADSNDTTVATTTPTGETPVAAAPAAIPEPSPEAIQQLVDIGFSENRARKALILNGNGPEEALLWLCEHSEDADIDDPLTPEQLQQLALANGPPPATAGGGTAASGTGASANTPAAPAAASNEQDEQARAQILEMGFTEEQLAEALQATNNNYDAAIAFLLGDRDVVTSSSDAGSMFLRSFAASPVIQRGIRHPRILEVTRAIRNNRSAMASYVNDPVVGPILQEVTRIIRMLES